MTTAARALAARRRRHGPRRVLSRLWRGFPLAPRAILCCDDDGVLGAPFFIMEYRPGRVVRATLPPDLASARRAVITSSWPAERLWPLTDEVIANRPFDCLDELEYKLQERCLRLDSQTDLITNNTSFNWWPEPLS